MVRMWVWLKSICSWRYEPHLKCKGSFKVSQWKCKCYWVALFHSQTRGHMIYVLNFRCPPCMINLIHYLQVKISKTNQYTIVNNFLSVSISICYWCSKASHWDVLLSTHSICFNLEKRKLAFGYALPMPTYSYSGSKTACSWHFLTALSPGQTLCCSHIV